MFLQFAKQQNFIYKMEGFERAHNRCTRRPLQEIGKSKKGEFSLQFLKQDDITIGVRNMTAYSKWLKLVPISS